MNELFKEIGTDLMVNALVYVLAAAVAVLGYYLRKQIKKQEKRDADQDQLNRQWQAEFERKLKRQDIRIEYFESQRFEAYGKIRQVAQRARDRARQIQAGNLITEYSAWVKGLFEENDNMLKVLYENALLLEHFGHYDFVHKFKNAFLGFCLTAKEFDPQKTNERAKLLQEFDELSKCYDVLVAHIRFPNE